ncbi:MAG TPA: substrate-binding domain-containing protein [bacterium]|nr:substrate-binding domain-containing protein [bacterium]HOH06143.1 substrate-binding domain-containing protein [bacterium]
MKKAILSLALLGLCIGCSQDKSAPAVALVMKTLNNPFFMDMQLGAEEAAQRLQLPLIVQAAERELDVEKQMQIIENLIQRKVAAICLTPAGSREVIPAILKANRAGIPVLILDTRVDSTALAEAGGKVATFIGSDNFDGGRIAGERIIEKLGGIGRVAILEGIPGHETGDSRLRGFHAAIDKAPGIRIVASQTANWERDQGYNVFQNILQSHPDVQAVFGCNDMMALGAVEAIAAAGRSADILVIGFDAITDAREAIAAGRMEASIAQNPREMGRLAIENAARFMRGEQIPAYIPVPIELVRK